MNRNLTYLVGPESILALVTAFVFWVSARHNSGQGRDVEVLEKVVMLLAFVVVPVVFSTIAVPGARSWSWLGRTVVLTYVGLGLCAGRLISGFGPGAKGQDAAFVLVFTFATMLVAIGTAVTGAFILASSKPAFGEWFQTRKIIGSVLVLTSALPIGIGLGLLFAVGIGVLGAAYSAIRG